MRRRDALKSIGAGAAAAAGLAAPAIAQSAPTIRWRCPGSFPPSADYLTGGARTLSKFVAEATDNKFIIQPFLPGEIVPALSVLDAVQNGTVEIGYTASYFYIGKDFTFGFGTSLPFGPNRLLQNAWLFEADGLTMLNEFYKSHKVYFIPGGNTGTQMAGWFRKELTSKADLVGLKFRTAGLAAHVLARLGVVAQVIPGGEIYQALERGTIDAAEAVGPYDDEKLGLQTVAKYYYYPGFLEGNAEVCYFINLDKWNELPPAYQSILRMAAAYASTSMQAKYDAGNSPALKRLVAAGAQLRTVPQDIMQESAKAAEQMYAEIAAKNPTFKKLYEHQMEFRNLAYLSWQALEFSYDSLMVQLTRQQRR